MTERLPLWRRLRRRCWYLVARAILAVVRTLPESVGRGLCRTLAWLAWRLRRRDRDLADRNLALAYPDRDPAWRGELLREAARALGDNVHAALSLERLAARGFPAVQDASGPDGRPLVAVLQDLQERGRGVLLVTAHLGCWELLGVWLASRVEPTAVVTGTVRNPAVDRLLQDRRRALGLHPLPREAGVRPVLRALADGAVVGALLDQNTRAAGALVPFMGRPAPTPLGLLQLAWRRGVPLVPAALVRSERGWVVEHLAPIEPASMADGQALAAACNRALEVLIRRNPAQWVWFHDRWRLRAAEPAP